MKFQTIINMLYGFAWLKVNNNSDKIFMAKTMTRGDFLTKDPT
jgi:hypothetical protein